jgi:DNA-binding CsgD family transcriptional regulator
MVSLRTADYRGVLELLAQAVQRAGPDFPDQTVTEPLRRLFQAEFAGAGQVDLVGTASHRWADSPCPLPASAEEFHHYAASHPLAWAYQRMGEPTPLRLSDVASARTAPPPYGGTRLSRVLTIPLAVAPRRVCAIALMRDGPDFSTRDLQLARQLQPVLGAIYALRDRPVGHPPAPPGVPLTARELEVLNLMADGLIMTAIARRLAISPSTVGKHIEHIYRKLGTHDRASTVLRGQALGVLAAQAAPEGSPAKGGSRANIGQHGRA